jgi:hypothetical protein
MAQVAQTFLFTDESGGALLCPMCGFNCTHLDVVYVAARPTGEDGDVLPIRIDSSGSATFGNSVQLPIPDVGRRHVISIVGYCEGCAAGFALEFMQHKGETLVAVREAERKGFRVDDAGLILAMGEL